METYLYFYLWFIVCYKLGNKGIGNTILSQRVAGGKNAKTRWNLYFCKTWECKKFFLFLVAHLWWSLYLPLALYVGHRNNIHIIYIIYNREKGTTKQCTTLFPIVSPKKGTGQKKYNKKINNIDNTLVLFWQSRRVQLPLFYLNSN